MGTSLSKQRNASGGTVVAIDFGVMFDEALYEVLRSTWSLEDAIKLLRNLPHPTIVGDGNQSITARLEQAERVSINLLRENEELKLEKEMSRRASLEIAEQEERDMRIESIWKDVSILEGDEEVDLSSGSRRASAASPNNMNSINERPAVKKGAATKKSLWTMRINKVLQVLKILRGSFRSKLAKKGMIPTAHAAMLQQAGRDAEPRLTRILVDIAQQ